MTKTTTVRVYPGDAAILEATRKWLQAQYGENHSMADAITYALETLLKVNPSINKFLAK